MNRRFRNADLGDYGTGDTQSFPGGLSPVEGPYDDKTIFRGPSTGAAAAPMLPGGMPGPVVGPATPPGHLLLSGSLTPFPFSTGNSSVQIIGGNPKRACLIIQNFSTGSNLYINFGTSASFISGLLLLPGQGFIFDTFVPINSIHGIFDSGSAEFGMLLEGIAA